MSHPDVECVSDIVYIAMPIHGCCKYVINISAVLNICCKCFIWILHLLQWLYTYVASICFKCSSCFKRMLQVEYVAVAIHICCKAYVCKCFIYSGCMLQQMLYVAGVA